MLRRRGETARDAVAGQVHHHLDIGELRRIEVPQGRGPGDLVRGVRRTADQPAHGVPAGGQQGAQLGADRARGARDRDHDRRT
ncbi:hypothetical protein SDC9_128054 [bioreactor metagenome]|uniref:Uncharacterized protein n=1 Tax=bioreactor metagenome TaxID=1076179 RepID=A0A645CVU5_9ZZZZ